MTCIVGAADGGRVVIGGDSAGVRDFDLDVRADRKVFRVGEAVFGFTTSFRMGQLLTYRLDLPRRHPDTELMRWMVTEFVDAVRTCLKAGGFAQLENGVERGGIFLVGIEGRLFTIEGDYQVAEAACGYAAIGCGESFARGAMYASGIRKRHGVELALRAAEAHSAGVRGPFHFEEC